MSEVVQVIKKLDLAAVSERTGLPIRTLRYAIDHDLVMGLRVDREGRGNARSLSHFDATVLAAAAALLDMGWSNTRVTEMMFLYRGAKRTSLSRSFWWGLKHGIPFWYFNSPFTNVMLDVGKLYSLLEGATDAS